MKVLTFFFLLFILSTKLLAQHPAVGLTLSGGGAKGLAHIGVLKAIDSAQLPIKYVTGTSMGAVIGSLYALGYSADTIEQIARQTNWDQLLSNNISLRSFSMQEKVDYGKYAIELPWVNNSFRLPSGVIESEELWLKLNELYFPAYKIKNFKKFSKSFECIATNISTGDGVVLDSNEIVYAIRSSMAIPSVFTAVNYQGKKLVDGGVVRNFPVIDAQKMGADFLIGSNVASGLLPKDKINNIIQVLLQIAFFRNDEDAIKEKALCNIYIPHDLEDYNMGSFGSADEIIDSGNKTGEKYYPIFKHLADSLQALYGNLHFQKQALPNLRAVKITACSINGLHQTDANFFLKRMQFTLNQWYTAVDLSEHIRKAFGTRYYNKILYSLLPITDSTAQIVFDVEENPLTFAKLGVNYNQFTGISLIANITSRDFFTPYSKSQVTVNIGENMRLRGEHIQYFGKHKLFSLTATTQIESLNINSYNNFTKQGLFKQGYFLADVNLRYSPTRELSLGAGTRFENLNYHPQLPAAFEARGGISYLNPYLFIKANSLTNPIYPKNGSKTDIEFGEVINQNPNVEYYLNGNEIPNPDSLGIHYKSYYRAFVNAEKYIPLTKRKTLFTQFQGGLNWRNTGDVINAFNVGGLTNVYKNQITFAGLAEGSVVTNSIAAMQVGLRYQIFNNGYIITKANGAFYDFVDGNFMPEKAKFLSGYSISFGYNFVLGPLEISAMYSDQSKMLLPYINLGIPF
ncbi:patatin-like phospholipase family protein [Hydrotalea sp.]|uniref:patatin-like phospholipase family protein n=1 Tax=Hydrotalea sp. TaxID=2881279 RepID=UPI00258BDD72|nr:patatin-like phospholipase family protein [Hydrotalea sp.]